jgi:uncharacterized protein YkwD
MNRRIFLRDIGASALTSTAVSLAGCGETTDETTSTLTPEGIPSFHATNAGVFSDISSIEIAIHEATNDFRAAEGHKLLNYNTSLAKISRNHSRNMAKEGFFDHNDHRGRSSGDRADVFGYPDASISENLYWTKMAPNWDSIDRIVKRTLSAWKNSPPHRATLLTESKIVAGVGGYVSEEHEVYITAMYADKDGEIPS